MRVLIADDNAVVRIGLAAVLRRLDSVDEIVEAVDGVDALDKVRTHAPDIVLLDVRMPRKDGLAVLEELAGSVPALMLTHSEEPDIVRMALDLGARGYLVHGATSPEEIGSALQTCLAGGLVLSASAVGALHAPPAGEPEPAPPHPFTELLTERELDVLSAAAAGQDNSQIAREQFLAPRTVRNYLNSAYTKLGVHSRSEAVVAWHEARSGAGRNMGHREGRPTLGLGSR